MQIEDGIRRSGIRFARGLNDTAQMPSSSRYALLIDDGHTRCLSTAARPTGLRARFTSSEAFVVLHVVRTNRVPDRIDRPTAHDESAGSDLHLARLRENQSAVA